MALRNFFTQDVALVMWTWLDSARSTPTPHKTDHQGFGSPQLKFPSFLIDVFAPLRNWLNNLAVTEPHIARIICHIIPSQCPFERDVIMFNHKLFHIPPLCKLNPFYEEFVGLRFRALCFLADDCGEDISIYL
ncbi:MAG: nitrogenase [Cyanobacteria bacterium WB6_1B_304]|jgi:Mo-dependent nitrogenase C-terminus|nr:nitrogenase [Cyanobacteria bacterium WB6_1B_304]